MKSLSIGILMTAAAAVPCIAQIPEADPFQIPDSTGLKCSMMRADELLKPGNVGFTLETASDGGGNRAIKAEFDSAGSPFALVLPAPSMDTLSPAQTNVMLFRKDGSVAVMTIGAPQFAPLDSTAKDNKSWLTDDEIVRAKALATWLWGRRCSATTSERNRDSSDPESFRVSAAGRTSTSSTNSSSISSRMQRNSRLFAQLSASCSSSRIGARGCSWRSGITRKEKAAAVGI